MLTTEHLNDSDSLKVNDGSLTQLRAYTVVGMLAAGGAVVWLASERPISDRGIILSVTIIAGLLLALAVRVRSYCFDRAAGVLEIRIYWLFGIRSVTTIPLADLELVTLRTGETEDGNDTTQVVLVRRCGEELQLSPMEYAIGGTGHPEAATCISEYLGLQLVRERGY
jgi:hypothetical protein